jgi:hypothetical protein
MEQEDPYSIVISTTHNHTNCKALLTHITARLGRHIFVTLCDKHRELMVIVL